MHVSIALKFRAMFEQIIVYLLFNFRLTKMISEISLCKFLSHPQVELPAGTS